MEDIKTCIVLCTFAYIFESANEIHNLIEKTENNKIDPRENRLLKKKLIKFLQRISS